ncbi:hypothetical protein EYF80_057677 [Liparis tanakae]|uniref:Uncharacterized protein n=1 Tax=Liparis tanakae TaxID=230148 RepID=A0A4Z2ETN7_9TELE|nr:hypothetical protein EYF80_057677 [Liparis tanakae]
MRHEASWQTERLHHVVIDELKVLVANPVLHIPLPSCEEVVHHSHLVAVHHQLVGQVGAHEAGSPGDLEKEEVVNQKQNQLDWPSTEKRGLHNVITCCFMSDKELAMCRPEEKTSIHRSRIFSRRGATAWREKRFSKESILLIKSPDPHLGFSEGLGSGLQLRKLLP